MEIKEGVIFVLSRNLKELGYTFNKGTIIKIRDSNYTSFPPRVSFNVLNSPNLRVDNNNLFIINKDKLIEETK